MPKTMKQLAGVQFFSWFALFSMWIYTTAGVTSAKYDMHLSSDQVGQLTQIAETLVVDETDKLDRIKEELSGYTDKIKEGASEVTSSVSLANFFLHGHIIPEKELLSAFSAGIQNVSGNPEGLEAARKELSELSALYADDNPGNDQLISYSTFDFIQKNQEQVLGNTGALDQTKLSLISRLKFVQKEYNEGANWVGVCFGVYNGCAALFAFLLIFLAKKTSRKTTHSIALIVGSLSFLSIFFIQNPMLLLIPFIGIGLVWASILAMPYAILTTALPSNKMGYYMGVFNFFIVIPQILAATFLGFFVRQLFHGEAIYAMFLGAASFFIAAILVFFVDDKGEPER
ncbi:MAG: MFS transporter [Saprospirales bacterium]|nr:MFS transporter [Saprospirales bacterium]